MAKKLTTASSVILTASELDDVMRSSANSEFPIKKTTLRRLAKAAGQDEADVLKRHQELCDGVRSAPSGILIANPFDQDEKD